MCGEQDARGQFGAPHQFFMRRFDVAYRAAPDALRQIEYGVFGNTQALIGCPFASCNMNNRRAYSLPAMPSCSVVLSVEWFRPSLLFPS